VTGAIEVSAGEWIDVAAADAVELEQAIGLATQRGLGQLRFAAELAGELGGIDRVSSPKVKLVLQFTQPLLADQGEAD
jgi:hypothetical protein